MTLLPLGSRILVRRQIISKRGQLYIPTNSREMKFSIGEVAAVGPDCTTLKAGDFITYGKYAPLNIDRMEIEAAGVEPFNADEEYLLLNEEDALCVVVKDAKEEEDAA